LLLIVCLHLRLLLLLLRMLLWLLLVAEMPHHEAALPQALRVHLSHTSFHLPHRGRFS
jgi:hypothetical protein